MDGDDFSWCSQSFGHDTFDLNSQVPAEEDFPRLQLYGDILRDDNDLTPARVRGTRLPPYRPLRVGAEDGTATPAAIWWLLLGGSRSRMRNRWHLPWRVVLGGRRRRSAARQLGLRNTRPASPARQHGAPWQHRPTHP